MALIDDRVGFWCEGYHRGQPLCICCGSRSAHGEEDLSGGGGVIDLKSFGSYCQSLRYLLVTNL